MNEQRRDILNRVLQASARDDGGRKDHHQRFLKDLINQNQSTQQTIDNFFDSLKQRRATNHAEPP